jgi:inorganic pyrophosphatase
MGFPLDFAFVPSTLAGAGDPFDRLILPEAALPVGSFVSVRILGFLVAEQKKRGKKAERNDRVVARLVESRLFAKVEHIDELGERFVEELSSFFSTYKRLRGQKYKVIAVGGPDRAADLIEKGAAAYKANGKR